MTSFVAALFGAVFQEILHWFYLRQRLESPKYRKLIRSRGYWLITLLVILFSSVGTAWFFGHKLDELELALLAAAFPTMFKKLVASTKQRDVRLGENRENESELYFS